MAKYIKVGSMTEELIPVVDVYAFIYESEKGKTVLRITIKDDVKSFDELKNLLSKGQTVYAFEKQENEDAEQPSEIVLTSEHYHYAKEYKCDYNADKGEFFIEITKKSDLELLAKQNEEDTLTAYAAIAELYEMNL